MIIDTNTFIGKFSDKAGYNKEDSKYILNCFVDVLRECLLNRDTIKLRGIFEMGVKYGKSRFFPHPHTKKMTKSRDGYRPYFHFKRFLLQAAYGEETTQTSSDSAENAN